jgi:hypothetical protein
VADADVPTIDADSVGDFGAFSAEHNSGLTAGVAGDFDVGPGDSAAPTCPQHLQHRLLGGESSGQMLVISLGIIGAISLLGRRVNTIQKSLAVFVAQLPNALRFDNIDPVTKDGHGQKVSENGRNLPVGRSDSGWDSLAFALLIEAFACILVIWFDIPADPLSLSEINWFARLPYDEVR